MRAKGFELFDINRSYWKRHGGGKSGGQRGQLVFGDALYLRPPEEFVERVTDHPKAKIIKATLVCLAYGYLDLAVAIWDQALSRSIVCHDDYRIAIGYFERENRVTTSIAKLIPARLKVARACQLLRDIDDSDTTGFFTNFFLRLNQHWDFRFSYGVDNDFSVFNPDIDLQHSLRIGIVVHN